ncbi:MAG TPA: MFS transporter [Acidimicrobiales bacterium]|nr:MFS transporter [Acidimicrobiales bacterium]
MGRRRILADVTPLRASRDFSLLFSGQLVSFLGSQLTVVAVPYQVYVLTHSSLAVGMVSLAQLGPLIIGSLIGGSIVDSADRRTLMLRMHVALAAVSVALAINAMNGRSALWPLFVLPAVAAAFSGVDRPARSAIIPSLLDEELLPAAYALWQIQMQLGFTLGPAAAGLLLTQVGLAAVFWIDAGTFVIAFVLTYRMQPHPPIGGGTKAGLGSIVEGLRFARGNRLVQGGFLIDLDAMILGMPRALFPALGTGLYEGGAATVGLLYAAPGAGALVGALTTGWVSRVRHQGRAVLIAVAVWGAAIAGFGMTRVLPLGLALLALAGAADVISAVYRNTIFQLAVPDALRGRLSALHIAVVTGGPRLGDAEAGAVAALTTPRVSVVSGGVGCMIGVVLVGWALPEFRRYRTRGGDEPVPVDSAQ